MDTPSVLSIAGLDPSGGAGLLADVEVFSQLGIRGFAVATALTGQSSCGVFWARAVAPSDLEAQLTPLLEDFLPHRLRAIKVGMLGSAENVSLLARMLAPPTSLPPGPVGEVHSVAEARGEAPSAVLRLLGVPPGTPRRAALRADASSRCLARSGLLQQALVLDPVLISSSGRPLLEPEGIELFCQKLLPLARVLTPNLDELSILSGVPRERPEEGARALLARGARAVLVKGGHAEGARAEDILYEGETITSFSSPRVLFPPGISTVRGTGCRLSSAIAAHLARGLSLREAVGEAKRFLDKCFEAGIARLGRGSLGYFSR